MSQEEIPFPCLYSPTRICLNRHTPSCTIPSAFLRRLTNSDCGGLRGSNSHPVPTAESTRVPPASKANMAEFCAFLDVIWSIQAEIRGGGTIFVVGCGSRPSNQ